MEVFLVRHGLTEGNVQQYAQTADEPLNPDGVEQAKKVAERCASLACEQIVTSDMKRARDTADMIRAVHAVECVESALFREVSYDESRIQADEAASLKREMTDHLEDDAWFVAHGLESYRAIQERAQQALVCLENLRAESVIVVTHGTFLKFLIGQVLLGETATPVQLHRFRMGLYAHNTGVTQISFQPEEARWKLKHWNDIRHLG